MTEPRPNEREIFDAARQLHTAAERSKYLDRACGADAALRSRVEALLRVNDHDHSFMEAPTSAVGMPPDKQPGEKPGTVLGPYTIVSLLGEGGMGAVYLAEQTHPVRRQVALKIIKAGHDSRSVIARFEAERQALAIMDHPNIAKVLDAGATETGRPYFVMELISGVPVTGYCDQHHLTLDQRLALFIPVCQAVQHAHQKGIIHRDLKPSNVLVANYDGAPVVKVIDFGVAKAVGSRLTENTFETGLGTLIGTLEYMSPEQAKPSEADIDTRSDIYSLGVLLYELLTGTTPFNRRKFREAAWFEMLRVIREDEPPKPSTRLSTISELPSVAANRGTEPRRLGGAIRGELDWIVMKSLEKDRDRRYATANSFARDIQNFLDGQPVDAGPPGVGYRLRKFVARHRSVVATSVAFVALLAAATAISIGLAAKANQARQEADAARLEAVQEQKRANQEAAAAKAVSDFLQKDLLAQADIAQQGGKAQRNRNITVRELLDRAALNIDSKFRDQPQTEAAIRGTLGRAYRAVGEFEVAKRQTQRALALRTEELGPHHRETLECQHGLGMIALAQGRNAEAEQILRQVLNDFRTHVGPDDRATWQCVRTVGLACFERGKLADAEALYREAATGLQAKFGEDDADALAALGDVATIQVARGHGAEAEPLMKQVIDRLRRKHGDDHPTVLKCVSNLAMLYAQERKFAQADPLFQQVYDMRRQRLGPDNPTTLEGMQNLATNLLEMGQFERGEELLKNVVSAQRRTLTDDHPETLLSINNLGEYYRSRGRISDAEPLFREAAERSLKTHGANHPHTLTMITNLALLHVKQATYDRVEAILRQAVSALPAEPGAEPKIQMELLKLLTHNLMEQKKFAEAEPFSRRYLDACTKAGPDRWSSQVAKYWLGVTLLEQGKRAEAEPMLRQAVAGMETQLGQATPTGKNQYAEAIERLAQLCEAAGKADEAAGLRKRLPPAKP